MDLTTGTCITCDFPCSSCLASNTSFCLSCLGNGVLNHAPGSHGAAAEAVVSTTRAELTAMLRRGATLLGEFDEGRLQVSGDRAKFRAFLATLDQFAAMFNIVEP